MLFAYGNGMFICIQNREMRFSHQGSLKKHVEMHSNVKCELTNLGL